MAPAIVEGVTRLVVGTFVEINKAGVGCGSATTGAESVEVGVPAESTGWSGSTFKFAGGVGGVGGVVVVEEFELTKTSLGELSSPIAGADNRRVGKSAKANPRAILLCIFYTSQFFLLQLPISDLCRTTPWSSRQFSWRFDGGKALPSQTLPLNGQI